MTSAEDHEDMPMHRNRFDECSEWDAIRHHPFIRYRPRAVPVRETFEVALPTALAAVEGKLTTALGDRYACCAALVGLRLGTGASRGQLDLMLLGRSADVALGECKLSAPNSHGASVQHASRQLERYKDVLRGTGSLWLSGRIADSYDRFDFPRFSELLEAIGVKPGDDQDYWWSAVAATIQRGAVDTFIATRTLGHPSVNVWIRSRKLTHNDPFTGTDPGSGTVGWSLIDSLAG